ncbi:MAG: hypothetical protein V4751_05345 [Pseudomonadota bacterium]
MTPPLAQKMPNQNSTLNIFLSPVFTNKVAVSEIQGDAILANICPDKDLRMLGSISGILALSGADGR